MLQINERERWRAKIIQDDFSGSEASVALALTQTFPGIGGTITTDQKIRIAVRKEFSAIPGHAIKLFYTHAVLKKLDDYFQRIGTYAYTHITRPVGSLHIPEETYLYEWAPGTDGFPLTGMGADSKTMLIIDEWNEFVGAFFEAGIDLARDCTDAENASLSQNIIHEMPRQKDGKLNCLWQRIDFGPKSIGINFQRLKYYIEVHKQSLLEILHIDRYEMMNLAIEFLMNGTLEQKDWGRLEILTRFFRTSTLRHLISSYHYEDQRDALTVRAT